MPDINESSDIEMLAALVAQCWLLNESKEKYENAYRHQFKMYVKKMESRQSRKKFSILLTKIKSLHQFYYILEYLFDPEKNLMRTDYNFQWKYRRRKSC